MSDFQTQQQIKAILSAALECSIYHAPTEPGLTFAELLEAGSRVGLQPGEINDVLPQVTTRYFGRGDQRLLPDSNHTVMWMLFVPPQEPDYRNPAAFEFVLQQLHSAARAYGAENARLERSVIVERAVADSLPRLDVEAAITIMLLTGTLVTKDGLLGYAPGRGHFAPPSAQMQQQQAARIGTRRNDVLARLYPVVKDVIGRRSDNRPISAEPLDGLAKQLGQLGHGAFRVWWAQLVAELRQASSQTSPVTVTVLAAALVEGGLAFCVKRAQALGLAVMGSKTFTESPTRWRIDDLVASAAAGGDTAILDNQTRVRAEGLVKARQRIHAGRMLIEFPGGVPELRPEEAREAQATAEQVIRRVWDWLQKHPSP
jgi:hypothetical protein